MYYYTQKKELINYQLRQIMNCNWV